jgi:hypothetical protein
MMERTILVIFICVVVGMGVFTGLVGFANGVNNRPFPSDYVTTGGNCWVKPQGDPLYDAHYAQQVNPYNCNSYKVQEQANNIKAETLKMNVDTVQGVTLAYATFGVVIVMLGLLVFAIVRG